MQKNKVFISLFGLDANAEFKYPKYFSFIPTAGPNPKATLTEGFFQVAAAQNPKPQTLAIAGDDAEFSHNAMEGARANAKQYGFKIVYDKTYPPNTTDYSPIVRAIQAANADLVVHLFLSAEFGRHHALRQRARPEAENVRRRHGRVTSDGRSRTSLNRKLNGIVNYDNWVPSAKLMAPAADFFKKYQARAPGLGIDPLGYYLGGWGYARMQLLADAITGAKSIDDDKLADYLRGHAFNTIMIDGIRFGKNGEWVKARQLQVQYHDLTDAADLDTWRGMSYQTVLAPAEDATGKVIYPFADALKA